MAKLPLNRGLWYPARLVPLHLHRCKMTTENATPEAAPSITPRALLKRLQTEFAVFRDFQPLAIGIDKQVQTRLPDVPRKILRIALGIHTNSMRYLRAMEKATARFDLDGQQTDEVTEAHRTHASEAVRERIKQDIEKRKAQKAAELAAEAERKRGEKLGKLIEKFGRGH